MQRARRTQRAVLADWNSPRLVEASGRGSRASGPQPKAAIGAMLEEVTAAVSVLDAWLRPAGLRINRASTGLSIVPIVRPDAGSGSHRERALYLGNLNQGDMVLLHRILTQRAPANTIAATNNGTVNLSRLEGAGLVVNEANELRLTERAMTAFGLPNPA